MAFLVHFNIVQYKKIIFNPFRENKFRKSLADIPLRGVGGIPHFPLRDFWQNDSPLRGGWYPLSGQNPLSSF